MEYICNTILTAICYVNRIFQHEIKPTLYELDTFPMFVDYDIVRS